MKKEIEALSKALENLLIAVLDKDPATVPDVTPTAVPTPAQPLPVVPPTVTPVAPTTPVVPVVPDPAPTVAAPVVPESASAAPGPVTHDEVRAHLLPIIQSNQNAMTAVHGVLTGQFKVNELTSLPVAGIPEFMAAVDAALAALPK